MRLTAGIKTRNVRTKSQRRILQIFRRILHFMHNILQILQSVQKIMLESITDSARGRLLMQ